MPSSKTQLGLQLHLLRWKVKLRSVVVQMCHAVYDGGLNIPYITEVNPQTVYCRVNIVQVCRPEKFIWQSVEGSWNPTKLCCPHEACRNRMQRGCNRYTCANYKKAILKKQLEIFTAMFTLHTGKPI